MDMAIQSGSFDGFQLMRGLDICEAMIESLYEVEVQYRLKLWRTSYGIFKRGFALSDIQLVLIDLAGKSVRMSGKRNTTFDTWLEHWCKYRKLPVHGIRLKFKDQLFGSVETLTLTLTLTLI